jgi:hypothetical protein
VLPCLNFDFLDSSTSATTRSRRVLLSSHKSYIYCPTRVRTAIIDVFQDCLSDSAQAELHPRKFPINSRQQARQSSVEVKGSCIVITDFLAIVKRANQNSMRHRVNPLSAPTGYMAEWTKPLLTAKTCDLTASFMISPTSALLYPLSQM